MDDIQPSTRHVMHINVRIWNKYPILGQSIKFDRKTVPLDKCTRSTIKKNMVSYDEVSGKMRYASHHHKCLSCAGMQPKDVRSRRLKLKEDTKAAINDWDQQMDWD
jgi:hypothetical protein